MNWQNQITIIIPTHNRPDYLKRILDYFSDVNIKIIVCDSSAKKNYSVKNTKNVEYKYFGNAEYQQKLSDTLKYIKTKYTVLCADDDFTVPSSIQQCVAFLENNPDYSSAQGQYVTIMPAVNKKIIINPAYVHANYKKYKIDSDNPVERLQKLFTNYMHLFYSVHKTNNLKDAFKICLKFNNYNAVELTIAIISIIDGKHKILPIFYSARESIPNSGGSYTDSFEKIAYFKKYKSEYDHFMNDNAFYLSKKEKISLDCAKKKLQGALKPYLEKCKNNKVKKLSNFLINFSPMLHLLARRGYSKLRIFKNWFIIKNMRGYPFQDKNAIRELNTIKKLIRHHKQIYIK